MKKRMLSLAVLAAPLFCFSNGANAQKIRKLLNGKDLSNWSLVVDKNSAPADQVYSVCDGEIFITDQPLGYVHIKGKYSDYKLHVKWRRPNKDPNANSDISLHIADLKSPFPNRIECNLQVERAGLFVLLGGSDPVEYQQYPGEECPLFPIMKSVNPSSKKPAGEWSEASIFVKDGVITVYINGIYQSTGANKVRRDHIGLQNEGKEAELGNVTLTE